MPQEVAFLSNVFRFVHHFKQQKKHLLVTPHPSNGRISFNVESIFYCFRPVYISLSLVLSQPFFSSGFYIDMLSECWMWSRHTLLQDADQLIVLIFYDMI